jgi:hypothetical protein
MSWEDTEAFEYLVPWHMLISVDFLEYSYQLIRILLLSVKLESQ